MQIYELLCKIRDGKISVTDIEKEQLGCVSFAHWKSLLLVRPDLINEIKNYLTAKQLSEVLSMNEYCLSYHRD